MLQYKVSTLNDAKNVSSYLFIQVNEVLVNIFATLFSISDICMYYFRNKIS